MAAAGVLTERILTFDSRTLDADVGRARESVAGEFAGQYDQISRSLIETAGRRSGTSIRSRVVRGGVVPEAPGDDAPRVTVLLFVEQTVASPAPTAPTAPRPSTVQLEVTMSEVGGSWLVSGLRPL